MPFPLPFRERRGRRFAGRQRTLDARTHARALANMGGERSLLLLPNWAQAAGIDDTPARHTALAAALGSDWVWPRWLARQIDPAAPTFTHPGDPPRIENVTGRTWTRVGTLGESGDATVDIDGLVQPQAEGASLDWWIRDGSGWRFPSRETTEQALVENTPVVRTRLDVAGEQGGIVAATAYGVAADPPLVVAEVHNATEAPVAVAFAIRPYNRESVAVVASIELDGDEVRVNGDVFAVLLDGPPAHVAMSDFARGDVAATLEAHSPGAAAGELEVNDPTGLASAALVYPLEHGDALRIALPLAAPAGAYRVSAAPHPDNVVRGWQRQVRDAASISFPDDRAGEAFDAQRCYLMLLQRGGWGTGGARAFPELAFVLSALGRLGRQDVVAGVLDEIPRRQLQHRFLFGREDNWDALAGATLAVADHWRFARERERTEDLFGAVELLVDSVDSSSTPPGLAPRASTPRFLGPPDAYFWDGFFVLRALRDAIEVADALDESRVASLARRLETEHSAALSSALDEVADRLGSKALPAGPRRRLDSAAIGSLVGCHPLGVLDADDPRVGATTEYLWDNAVKDRRFFHSVTYSGWAPRLTTYLAGALMARRDARGWALASALFDLGSPTWTWPVAVHPLSKSGCFGEGHDVWAAASLVTLLCEMCVTEVDGGLELFASLPDELFGDLAVSGLRTRFGTLDVRLGFEGATPVLSWRGLWGAQAPTLRAPAFDPNWVTTEAAGAARLG